MKMSRTHEGQRAFPFGNPFRTILHRGSYLSPKLRALLHSFEENLTKNLKKLKPENAEDVLSLRWMRTAVESLAEAYADIKLLINELQFPASDWDEKWIDIYLDSSVKLLDVCNALSSELSRVDQGQLLLQYVLHILDPSRGSPSTEQLMRADSTLCDWTKQVCSTNSKLETCATVLKSLQEDLCLPKIRKSAKGKVLIRALYGVKVMTVFICSIFATASSGCLKQLINLPISEKFLWFEAFRDLESVLSEEIRRQFLSGKARMFKELEAVETCVSRLHVLTNTIATHEEPLQQSNEANHFKEVIAVGKCARAEREGLEECKEPLPHSKGITEEVIIPEKSAVSGGGGLRDCKESIEQCDDLAKEVKITEKSDDTEDLQKCDQSLKQSNGISHVEEVQITEKSADTEGNELQKSGETLLESNNTNDDKEVQIPERSVDTEGEEGLQACISNLAERVAVLGSELDTVSKQVNCFFRTVLSGRDALLCNFRASDAAEETKSNEMGMNG